MISHNTESMITSLHCDFLFSELNELVFVHWWVLVPASGFHTPADDLVKATS